MKKIVSLILAMVMMMAMMVPAMATMEGPLDGGSITINDAVAGQDYKAYQILYLESYNADSNAYSYKANSAWAEWLATQTTYVTIDEHSYVTWVEGASAADFAKAAQAQLSGKTADASATAGSTTVVLDNLKLGYYLVDTTLGALCSLDTTNPDVVMEEKNEVPVIDKEVQEDSNSQWGDTNDADINQTVNFESDITVRKGAENYILHDKMSEGLDFIAVNAVKIGDAEVDALNYTITTDGLTDECTFEIAFDNTFIAGLEVGTVITVSYSAKLNANAVIGLPGNPNDIRLQYGDTTKPSYTPWDETITYTWDMEVLKYANGDKAEVLEGVKFVLLNKDKTKVATVVNGKMTGWADVPAEGAQWPANAELVTDANGKISIEGLDADTYYLRETEALTGYNKLVDDVEVVITGATVSGETLAYTTVVAEVENKSGSVLPETGGMGTTMMYIGGGLLVAFAVVMLITKRRMNAAE